MTVCNKCGCKMTTDVREMGFEDGKNGQPPLNFFLVGGNWYCNSCAIPLLAPVCSKCGEIKKEKHTNQFFCDRHDN